MIAECPQCRVSKVSDRQDDLNEFQERHATEHHEHTLLWLRAYVAKCLHPHCTWQASHVPPKGRIDWTIAERKVATRTVRMSFREHHQ